jgi:hypothetical protein
MIKKALHLLLDTTVEETPAWKIAAGLLVIYLIGLISGIVINATIIFKIG